MFTYLDYLPTRISRITSKSISEGDRQNVFHTTKDFSTRPHHSLHHSTSFNWTSKPVSLNLSNSSKSDHFSSTSTNPINKMVTNRNSSIDIAQSNKHDSRNITSRWINFSQMHHLNPSPSNHSLNPMTQRLRSDSFFGILLTKTVRAVNNSNYKTDNILESNVIGPDSTSDSSQCF